MEVAISVDRFDLIALAEGEADLRLFAGMQLLALIALLGLIVMVLYKPRTWCAFCPMGTMTQGICKLKDKE